jgi:hypothetical protein
LETLIVPITAKLQEIRDDEGDTHSRWPLRSLQLPAPVIGLEMHTDGRLAKTSMLFIGVFLPPGVALAGSECVRPPRLKADSKITPMTL